MKKPFAKILVIFIVLACLITPLFFLVPEKPTTTALEAPISCALSVADDGTVHLTTQENELASKYVFAICDSAANSSDSNYYIKIESDTNTIDATEYFTGNKNYYYYAYYKGVGAYTNSVKTDTESYTNTIQLAVPTNFAREGTVLGWDAVAGAVNYTIFNGTTAIATQTARTYDFSSMLDDMTALHFQVRANGDALHITSQKTNIVSYIVHVQLGVPTNLSYSGTGAALKLNWNAVENASTYTVKINNSREVIASTNSLNLATYFTSVGPYSFKVKTNDNANYIGSAYSASSETYTKYQTLSTPNGLTGVKNSQFIELSWNAVAHATSYTLKINGTEYSNITATTYTINTTIILPNDSLSYEIQVKANASGYYNNSIYSAVYVYCGYTQFASPTNINITKTNNIITATWNAVPNATSYTVLVDNVSLPIVTTNSINLTTICTLPQSYNIQVRVNANIDDMIVASAYCVEFEYRNLIEIAMPTDIVVNSDGTYLILSFTAPENSTTFTLTANGTIVEDELSDASTNIALNLLPVSTNGKYVFGLYANENGYYSQSQMAETEQLTLLATPSDVVTERDDSKIYISWNEVDGASSYDIYINNILISDDYIDYITETNVEILLTDVEESLTYSCRLLAKSSNGNYLMSSFTEEKTIDYNTKRSTPTGLEITKNGTSYVASWNEVMGSYGYVVAINNSTYNCSTTSFTLDSHITTDEIYSIRVRANGNSVEANSDFCTAKMLNTTQNFINNYSDRYFYLNGWNDYNIENEEELNNLILYFIYNAPSEITYYSNYDTSISNKNKFTNIFDNIAETRSISYRIQDNAVTRTIRIYDVTHLYKQGGALTTKKVTTTQMENARYSLDTRIKANTIAEQVRAESYNNFACENSLIEVAVTTSNQLYKAIEDGAKPIIVATNTHLLNVYNTAKQLLRRIITDEMTEYEKAYAIFDWITDNCYYDYLTLSSNVSDMGSYNCFYIEGVLLDKVAVCDGFAKTYAMLCSMEGIECIKIGGSAGSGDHAWNKVKLNIEGTYKWYAVDATWSNAKVNKDSNEFYMMLTHKYFLLNDEAINVDHTARSYNPTADGTKTYYDIHKYDGTHDLKIESTTELSTLVYYMADHRKTVINPNGVEGFEFHYFDMVNYQTHLSNAFYGLYISYSTIVTGSIIIVMFA